jgi:hypothetical protein
VDQGGWEQFGAALVSAPDGEPFSLATVCQAITTLLPVCGAAIVLMASGSTQGIASTADSLTASIQDLEFTLGEGPGIDAFSQIEAVCIHDMGSAISRWAFFVPAALGLGVRSIYSLPLRSGRMALGTVTLWSDRADGLDDSQQVDAALVADLVCGAVLTMQSETTSEALAWPLDLSDHRIVVHQATGMISAQLGCTIDEALVRLRAHAYAAELPIDEVAKAVISRQLRFDR